MADKPNARDCTRIGEELAQKYVAGEIDRVELVYHHFKSAGSQILTVKRLYPIDIEEAMNYDHTRDLKSQYVTEDAAEYLEKQGGHHALHGTSSNSKPTKSALTSCLTRAYSLLNNVQTYTFLGLCGLIC